MTVLKTVRNFKKVLYLLLLCKVLSLSILQNVTANNYFLSGGGSGGGFVPLGLVILFTVNGEYVQGATIPNGQHKTYIPAGGVNEKIAQRVTRSRVSRQLSLIAPALQTMGCLPKFFCGMNSKKPSEGTSTLNDLAYLIRFAMIDDEPDSGENRGKGAMNSEEDSDERNSDERRVEDQKFEHIAEEQLIMDDPEYLNFIWKDMKTKIKNKFKDGKMEDEVFQQMVNELDDEDKGSFKLPSLFSGLKSLVRIGRDVSERERYWTNYTQRRSRAFWETAEFDEQMKLAARIGKTTNTEEQCTSTFNLCPYSVNQMKSMVTGEPPKPPKTQPSWYVNSNGPKEGDLTTTRPVPRPRPTTRQPRPTTKSPSAISHAIYALNPESIDGRRPAGVKRPVTARPPKPYLGTLGIREGEDDESGYDAALSFGTDIPKMPAPTGQVKIVKLTDVDNEKEESEDNDGPHTSSEEENKESQVTKPIKNKGQTKIGLQMSKYTIKHKYRNRPLSPPRVQNNGNRGKQELPDYSSEDEQNDNSKDKTSQESEEIGTKKPESSREKDEKDSDESNELPEKKPVSEKTPIKDAKDDKSSEEKASSEEKENKFPKRKRPNFGLNDVSQGQRYKLKQRQPSPSSKLDGNGEKKVSEESTESDEKENAKDKKASKDSAKDKSSEEKSSEEQDNKKQQPHIFNNHQKDPETEEYEYSQEQKRPSSLRPIKYSYFKGGIRPTNPVPTQNSHSTTYNNQNSYSNRPSPTPTPGYFSSWFGGTKNSVPNRRPSQQSPQYPPLPARPPKRRIRPDGLNRPNSNNNGNPQTNGQRPERPEKSEKERRPDPKGRDESSEDSSEEQLSSPPPTSQTKKRHPATKDQSSSEEQPPPPAQPRPTPTYGDQDVDNHPIQFKPLAPNPHKPQSRFPKLPRFPPPPRPNKNQPPPVPNEQGPQTNRPQTPTHKKPTKQRKDEDYDESKQEDKSEEEESKEDDKSEESQESKEKDPSHVKNIFSKASIASLGEGTSYSHDEDFEPAIPPPPPPIANWVPANTDEKITTFSNITRSPNAQATLSTPTKPKISSGEFGSYEKPENSQESKEDDSAEGTNIDSKEKQYENDDEDSDEDGDKKKKRVEDDEAENKEPPRTKDHDVPELGDEVITTKVQLPDPSLHYPALAPVSNFDMKNEIKVPLSPKPSADPNKTPGSIGSNMKKPTRNQGGTKNANSNSGPGVPGVPSSPGGGNRNPGAGTGSSNGNSENSSEEKSEEEVGKSSEEEAVADKTSEEDDDEKSGRSSLITKLKKGDKDKPKDDKSASKTSTKDSSPSESINPTYGSPYPLPPVYKWASSPTTLNRLTKPTSIKHLLKRPKPTKDTFYSKPLSPKLVQYLRDTYGNSYVQPKRTTTTPRPRSTTTTTKKPTKSKTSNRNTFHLAKLGGGSSEVIHFDEFEHDDDERENYNTPIGHRMGTYDKGSASSKKNGQKKAKPSLPPVYGKHNSRG